MPQKIIMYFKKERPGMDPFMKFDKKREVYRYFFQRGKELGFDMYLASGPETYLGGLNFKDPAFFDGENFIIQDGAIAADAVYDRSGGINFPSEDISGKVLNCSKFKILCNDKNQMYGYFGRFMPKSFEIKSGSDFKKYLAEFEPQSLVVLKPAKGLGGKGIIIDTRENLEKIKLDDALEYALQEFIDTSCGIEGITGDKHDLRVVIADGKIVLSHLRTPKAGSYFANAAQGGTIREVSPEKIPAEIIHVVEEIQKIVDLEFNFPIYSIDFGVTERGPLVFELNDQIGFPSAEMKNAKPFIENILLSLIKLCAK